ncbi:hypothetical protein ACHAWF_005039 [Thalassiosira exigua]
MAAAAAVLDRARAMALLLLLARRLEISAFQFPATQLAHSRCYASTAVRADSGDAIDSMFGPRVEDGEDVVLYSDDQGAEGETWGVPSATVESIKKKSTMSRWGSLNPKIKGTRLGWHADRIVKEAHERAIRNKKRREPAAEKKRRLYTQYKEMQQQSKREKHVRRKTSVSSKSRTRLSDIAPGTTLPGQVISLTRFGAYVDVGTEVDGLLHVSQITRDEFVDHPRRYLSPGDEVEVRVVRLDPQEKKLHLTMLPEEVLEEENVRSTFDAADDGEDDRIQLDEVEVDDELWGEIRRVTDYGAYVELGAAVRGFLHFMDHPMFGEVRGAHPREFMRVGDRVRVWVLDVDGTQKRIKLTANRPPGLPGPRREIQWI